jgi:hypothetical protein
VVLKQRLDIIYTNEVAHDYPHGGFGGMSNRTGKSRSLLLAMDMRMVLPPNKDPYPVISSPPPCVMGRFG